jgi:tetratricopeptide (TPR) repeat protein
MILCPKSKRWANQGVLAIALIAATILFYWPALHGGFLWDDDTYISANPALLSLAGLRAIWIDPSATCQYYPLSFTFFWAIYQLCGLNPLGFHLATLLLHCVAVILFWQVLLRLRVRGALLAAAIFALHPVNVMSVAWMTELKNTLSASLALGAAWAYIRFARLGVYESASPKETTWPWYVLSLALFLLAMLAKTAVSFLPATLFLVLWWQRERITRRDILSLIPMLAISLGMGAFTIYIERHAGGASGPEFKIGFLDRLLISGRSFWFYLGKLLWPSQLTFIYERWNLDAGDWRQWLYPVAALAVLSGAWMARRRIGKGVFAALMHFYISTSLLILVAVLYMMRFSFVADHWQYFGSLSIIALIASGITGALDRLGRWARPLEMGLGLALVLGLGLLTSAQCRMYSDIETLWRATIARNPQCWMAYTNLGNLLWQQGRTQESIAACRQALRIKPDSVEASTNIGDALFHQGKLQEAVAQFREALRLDPNYAYAHNDLGLVLVQQGRPEEAIAQFREASRIKPNDSEAHNNLAGVLRQQGRPEEAIAEYREALRINPVYGDARFNLGATLLQVGRPEQADPQFRAALQINPLDAEAHYNLGESLLNEGHTGEAIDHIQEALQLQPANLVIQNTLAWILAAAPQSSLRDGARAVQLAAQASQSTGGNNPVILRTLAAAYAETGQFPIAVQTAQKALQLAQAQSNTALANALPQEIKLYQTRRSFEEVR